MFLLDLTFLLLTSSTYTPSLHTSSFHQLSILSSLFTNISLFFHFLYSSLITPSEFVISHCLLTLVGLVEQHVRRALLLALLVLLLLLLRLVVAVICKKLLLVDIVGVVHPLSLFDLS